MYTQLICSADNGKFLFVKFPGVSLCTKLFSQLNHLCLLLATCHLICGKLILAYIMVYHVNNYDLVKLHYALLNQKFNIRKS